MVLLATLALVGSHAVTATSSTTLQQSDTTVAEATGRRRAVPSRDVPGEGVNGFQTGAASVGSPQERLLSSTNSSLTCRQTGATGAEDSPSLLRAQGSAAHLWVNISLQQRREWRSAVRPCGTNQDRGDTSQRNRRL